MRGGIDAWRGLVAEGIPEAGMAHFSSAASLEEMAGLAWLLEDGNRRFYSGIAGNISDEEAKKLFNDLASAEERHKSALLRIYLEKTGKHEDRDFPSSVLHDAVHNDVMEGGISVNTALEWAKGKDLIELLEFSMSIETNSYDLYLKMMRTAGDGKYGDVFRVLSEEERDHLHRFSSLLEKQH